MSFICLTILFFFFFRRNKKEKKEEEEQKVSADTYLQEPVHSEKDMLNKQVSCFKQVQEVQEEEDKEEPKGVQQLQQRGVRGGRRGSQRSDVGGENLHGRTLGRPRGSAHPRIPGRQTSGVSFSHVYT